jgi:hypothetical protein
MELQGPEKFQDSFARELLRFSRGGIVSSDLVTFCMLDMIKKDLVEGFSVVSAVLRMF